MLERTLGRWLRSFKGRRSHPRAPATVPVDWRVFGSGVHHVTQVGDLSPGGAFVEAAEPRPVGSPIVLHVPTARGLLCVHARVAWTRAGGMGLRFTRPLAVALGPSPA